MRKRLVWGLVFAIMLTATISQNAAIADPGGPIRPGTTPPAAALQPIDLHPSSPARGVSPAAIAGQCWGFSAGGPINSTTANGYAYNECSGDILGQHADVHIWYCVAIIFGNCFPFQDLGSIASRDIFGPGGFWTPEIGTATRGGLTPNNSYMIYTTLSVLVGGVLYQGSSSSLIFTLPQ